jgi:nuclear pore complex protein Nup93
MRAAGDSAAVRESAALYSSLPQTVSRNVPQLIIWTIQCCSQQRAILAKGQFTANDGTRRMMIDDLTIKAKDMMMYAGFLRYRLPPSVNDTLARIAAE